MASRLRFGFTGDVMLGRLVDERQHRRPTDAVWSDVLPRLHALDAVLVNLECGLSTRGEPWTETNRPFHFRADPDWAVPALEQAGVDWACLANNHVLDFGRTALTDTLAVLDEAGIAHTGAGRSVQAAWTPSCIRVDDCDVALIAITDNTPEYAAGPDEPGTAYAEIDVDNANTRAAVDGAIAAARHHDPDLIFASLHWGPNMVEAPPADFQEFGRWLIDSGVDLVHGHSAHIFQGIEIHDGAPIIYDAGDFVDDYAVDPDFHNDRGFLFEATIAEDDASIASLRVVPTVIDDCSVHLASGDIAEWSRNRMRQLSAAFDTAFDRDGETLVIPIED